MKRIPLALAATLLHASASPAGEADVLSVEISCDAKSVCHFTVTLRHEDEGWSHYADKWEVLTPEDRLLATRILAHPHVDEQPFTRSLGGVAIPEELSAVKIRGHDSVHGYGRNEVIVAIPGRSTE